jgi:anaerobic selenocysteine-containing dehydrogenase
LAAHGVAPGEIVELRSAHGTIPVIVAADAGLRRGLVSMMFGYGGPPERDGEVATLGSSVNRLTSSDELFDRYTGQPRMSNVPVALGKSLGWPVAADG